MNTDQINPDQTPSELPAADRGTQSRRARHRAGLVASLTVFALVAAGCTGGAGNREDFIDVLTVNDNFSEQQAICITDAVFDQYEEDADALQKISGAESYEWLIGEDGVVGFDSFFSDTVSTCTAVGPSPDE